MSAGTGVAHYRGRMDWTEVPGFAAWAALTSPRSLVAQPLRGRRWVGSRVFWIAAGLVYESLYLHQGLRLTAVLNVGFLGLCLVGLAQWRRAREEGPPIGVVRERSVVA